MSDYRASSVAVSNGPGLAPGCDAPVITPAPLPEAIFVDLPSRIRATAADRPDATALIHDAGQLDWSGLACAMDAVAGLLAERGVGPRHVVASVGGNTADHLALYLGALAAGCAMAPLPVSAHPDTIAAMVANCAPSLIFADDAGQGALGAYGAEPLDGIIARAGAVRMGAVVNIAPHDAFDIIYSSGTTGTPKGIMHTHDFRNRQIVRLAGFGFGAGEVCLASTPIYSNTTLAALLPALAGGAEIVLMGRFDAGRFLRLAERHAVSAAMLVPVQYRRILAHRDFERTDLSAFRTKLSTSAPLPAPLVREVLDRWPGRLVNIYGMTEGGVGCLLDCTAHPDKLHTVGRPVKAAQIRILDAQDHELPLGQTGEIVGRSATMMTGYLGDADKTRAVLWTSPEGDQFIRSGDMGHIDADGFLCLMDRSKDMINSGGFNVFPADLEAVLQSHPDVAEAAVIAIPSADWGETPMAFVVLRAGTDIDPEKLGLWANARLGKTQRIAAIELRDSLPRSDIGKVLKRDLRAPYWGHQP